MIIVFEGIDGSGKRTQAELLKEKAQSLDRSAAILAFPRYSETLFGRCVADYLNGQFGDLASVSPKLASLLYAGDRFESLATINQLSQSLDLLILDRYVASNIAHQGSKLPKDDRDIFISWITQIEYGIFSLPKPDITLFLDMSPTIASELIHKKEQRNYTLEVLDIHEKDFQHLVESREIYNNLAKIDYASRWITIQCTDPNGRLYKQQEVFDSIWNSIHDAVETISKDKSSLE